MNTIIKSAGTGEVITFPLSPERAAEQLQALLTDYPDESFLLERTAERVACLMCEDSAVPCRSCAG
jgi:hypothetical protein